MKKTFFDKITQQYAELDRQLVKTQGNVCKESSCNECCTIVAKGGNHPVKSMELDYIETYYREKGYPQSDVEEFKEYLSAAKNETGDLIHQICPFWNIESHGCSIYPARPFSCRAYGTIFIDGGFPPPTRCYFKTIGKQLSKKAVVREMPQSIAFEELAMEYSGNLPILHSGGNISLATYGNNHMNEKASDQDPVYQAQMLKLEGKNEEAILKFDEAIRLCPTLSVIHYLKGVTLHVMQRHQEALQAVSQAAMLNPKVSTYHCFLGIFHEQLGKSQEAIAEYEKTITLNPEQVVALFNLSFLLVSSPPPNTSTSENLLKAKKYLLQARQVDPTSAEVQKLLRIIYQKLGDPLPK